MALGMFGLGASRSRSSSTSQSSGYSVSGSRSSVFGADLFSELFGNASAAAAGINGDALTETANRLFDSGAGFVNELGELAGEGPAGAGEQYLTDQLGGGDDIAGEIDSLQADLGEFFGEVVMPGIRGDALAVGGLGGDRQGVAEGIAGKGLVREFAKGSMSIRQNAQARRTSIAQTLAGLQSSRRLTAAGAGLSALPQQFQMAEAGGLAALSPFMALADILGDPAILSESFGYGEDQSSSSSTSKSNQYQVNVGAA